MIVDTGLGNMRSVERAVELALAEGQRVVRTHDPDRVRRADRLVLPGQGAFRDTARALDGGLGEVILEHIRKGTPYLGICMGLQLLFGSSEESPGDRGLGWFDGSVRRLEGGGDIKIPHMGWNQIDLHGEGHPVLEAAGGAGAWFYFVHSYHAVPDDPAIVAASCSYGPNEVTAAVARDNVFATQFHPEKSQRTGAALLRAFFAS